MSTLVISRIIEGLKPNTLIFNRHFLNYCSRASIDMCLSRMYVRGYLNRLAYGIYVRHDCTKSFSPQELATAKAITYNREITIHPTDTAKKLKLIDEGNAAPTYHAHGRKTSFQCLLKDVRVHYQGTSPRRVAFKNLATGDAINALWSLKMQYARESDVVDVLQTFNRKEKEEFLWSHHLMTGWLSDLVHEARGWHITFPLLTGSSFKLPSFESPCLPENRPVPVSRRQI